jgi:hypothetical protein
MAESCAQNVAESNPFTKFVISHLLPKFAFLLPHKYEISHYEVHYEFRIVPLSITLSEFTASTHNKGLKDTAQANL